MGKALGAVIRTYVWIPRSHTKPDWEHVFTTPELQGGRQRCENSQKPMSLLLVCAITWRVQHRARETLPQKQVEGEVDAHGCPLTSGNTLCMHTSTHVSTPAPISRNTLWHAYQHTHASMHIFLIKIK